MVLTLKSDILIRSCLTRHFPHADAWRSRQRYISHGRRSNFKTAQERVQPSFLISHLPVRPDVSDDDKPTIDPPCASCVVLSTATMVREPEPLERVRALVCEPCWVNCFDTEGFENLGRGDTDEFRYDVSITCGYYAMLLMIKGFCGMRMRQSPRTLNEYDAG